MRQLLSPKQVARAIGVSESSLKRWCDQGLIPTQRTAGGHRRLELSDVVTFLRTGDHALVRPEVLGLHATAGPSERALERVCDEFTEALVRGDEEVCRRVIVDLLLAGHDVAAVCDRVVAAAFHRVGDLWDCGSVEVYQERRGCEISQQVVRELRTLLPDPEFDAPVAMGGTVDGDPYTLSTSMAELVLREVGFATSSLGNQLPFATLHAAVRRARPQLFWLSVSAIRDVERFVFEWNSFFETCLACETALVAGGRALEDDALRGRIRYCCYCDKLIDLAKFGRTVMQTFQAARGRAGEASPA
jgi:excisionase family DNA binding protein